MPNPFDDFLSWFSPDREEAAVKYEYLKTRLVRFFAARGCHIADELTDGSIDRAIDQLAKGALDRQSVDPIRYCFGVAKNVYKEYLKKKWPDLLREDFSSPWAEPEWSERELACLDSCMARLSEHDRDLMSRWYQCGKGREKIEKHKKIAEEEGGMSALGPRLSRLRTTLRDCVSSCLGRDTGI